MKKKSLIVFGLIVLVILVFYFASDQKVSNNSHRESETMMGLQQSLPLTETFMGKFVSFKYPKGFSVEETGSNIRIKTNTAYDDSFGNLFTVVPYSASNEDKAIEEALDEWFNTNVLDTDKGAPNPDQNLSYLFKIANKYNSYYTIFLSEKLSFKYHLYNYFSPIDIYLDNKGKVFVIATQKLDDSDAVRSEYSPQEISQIRAYEKIFWDMLDTLQFK